MTTTNDLSRYSSNELTQELNRRNTKMGGVDARPASVPASANDNLPVRAVDHLIYGDDDRKDIYEIKNSLTLSSNEKEAIRKNANSVVLLLSENEITDKGDGTLIPQNVPFIRATADPRNKEKKEYKRLRGDVPFYGQPQLVGEWGSGFLVAPDIVATAAHCIFDVTPGTSMIKKDLEKLKKTRFIFGFQMLDQQNPEFIKKTEVYEADCVIDYRYEYNQDFSKQIDWALVRLKRPVKNHTIVSIRFDGKKISDNQLVHVIGHPLGLPLKYAGHAKVWNNENSSYFATNLDAFGGNSGSPVFNATTHVIEGIYVTGLEIEFEPDLELIDYLVPKKLSDDAAVKSGSGCTRITTEFTEALKKAAWNEFKPVAGLCGEKNQGADVAVADLNGNGKPDLIAFHIQNPDGENKGFYQIGRDLDDSGNVTGWSEFIQVPGRFGVDTEEAGIAITDLNNNRRPDLVVFHIEKTAGGNCGFYRVGCDLNDKGNVTRGWTQPIAMPGRLGNSTQGAGIAVTDLSGNGKPDLIVFFIDNPEGENKGYYRIGRDLDANGKVTGGWSEFIRVPGWFGSETQGAGIAIEDVSGNGRPDLIVFHLDNPPGGNTGYYRIGRDLDQAGNVTGGWNEIKSLPGFFGHESQGAGITTARINDNTPPRMIVYHIDNPAGANKGYYRTGWILP